MAHLSPVTTTLVNVWNYILQAALLQKMEGTHRSDEPESKITLKD